MNNKIGIGVVTCGREEMFQQCLHSISDDIGTIVVVNDATPYSPESYPKYVQKVIQHTTHKPIATSKNELMRYLISEGCDHIFTIEDDIYIKDPKVFEIYIKTAEATGIWHLNYGYHGLFNLKNGVPNPRQVIEYGNGIRLALNQHIVGAFSYFYREVIEGVGYYDERFINQWEHVDLTTRVIKMGLHPPFWWFADVADSHHLIGDLDPTLSKSVLRKDETERQKNKSEGAELFKLKHGYYPIEMPGTSEEEVLLRLEIIQRKFGK